MSLADCNQLELTGHVTKILRTVKSPSGIVHSYLIIEHRSIQQQAGFNHQVYCRLKVVLSGSELQSQLNQIQKDTVVKVIGYLAWQQNKQGDSSLVLHASQIERIS